MSLVTETINKTVFKRSFTRAEIEQLLARAVLEEAQSAADPAAAASVVLLTPGVDAAAPDAEYIQSALVTVTVDNAAAPSEPA